MDKGKRIKFKIRSQVEESNPSAREERSAPLSKEIQISDVAKDRVWVEELVGFALTLVGLAG